MAVEYRLDSGLSNAEAHTSLFLCKSQSWVCMTCPSSSRWAAGCLQLCSSPLGFLLSSLARAFEACSRGRSRSQGAGAWTPPILCQPQGNLFSACTALDYSDGNWKQVFFFVDYASCNGLIERCSQPLSQRSLNIYFRPNQVQWQQKK